MGLGKTCQTITFLAWLKHQREQQQQQREQSNDNKTVRTGQGKSSGIDDDVIIDLAMEDTSASERDDDNDDNNDDEEEEEMVVLGRDHNCKDDLRNKKKKKKNETYYHPHLIVAPASVLSNWEREFEKFAPHLHVVKYHGTQAQRRLLQDELKLHLPKNWILLQERRRRQQQQEQEQQCVTPLDVILTPITYFQKEKSDDRAFLRKFQYHYLVVDEAHLLKNAQGLRYTTLHKMETQNRLLLTGTPVQNSPQELMSLLCFLMPLFSNTSHNGGSFRHDNDDDDDDDDHGGNKKKNLQDHGGQGMLQHFVSLEGKGGTTGSGSGSSDGIVVDDATAYQKLKQLFAPFVLRRRKQDVLHQMIPPKERKVEFVQLNATARAVYNDILSKHVVLQQVNNNTNKQQPKNSSHRRRGSGGGSGGSGGGGGGSAKQVDHVFTQLRKAAHHPLLLRTRYTSETERQRLAELFHEYGAFRGDGNSCTLIKVREAVDQMNDFDIHLMALELMEEEEEEEESGNSNHKKKQEQEQQLRRHKTLSPYILMEDDLFSSAKCVLLRQLVPQLVADGHRILIFSIWTNCLDLLSCLMEQMGFKYLRMQGSTPVPERQGMIDEFTKDTSIPIFLLSTKACGLGINLVRI